MPFMLQLAFGVFYIFLLYSFKFTVLHSWFGLEGYILMQWMQDLTQVNHVLYDWLHKD